jgi:hypothetical protein
MLKGVRRRQIDYIAKLQVFHALVYTDDVNDCKEFQHGNKASPQAPDVLSLQSLKLNGLVNAFVDLIYAVVHILFLTFLISRIKENNCKNLSNGVWLWGKWGRTTLLEKLKMSKVG